MHYFNTTISYKSLLIFCTVIILSWHVFASDEASVTYATNLGSSSEAVKNTDSYKTNSQPTQNNFTVKKPLSAYKIRAVDPEPCKLQPKDISTLTNKQETNK